MGTGTLPEGDDRRERGRGLGKRLSRVRGRLGWPTSPTVVYRPRPRAGTVHAGPMRLFVAAWPPMDVVDRLRSVVAALRDTGGTGATALAWTAPERWHVTLAFLGESEPGEIAGALGRAATSSDWPAAPPVASIGPATTTLPPSTLVLPVGGLSPLAAAVRLAAHRPVHRPDRRPDAYQAAPGGAPAVGVDLANRPDEPFVGHLTVARARRRAPGGALDSLSGWPLPAGIAWVVPTVCLVASERTAGRSSYVTVAEIPVGDQQAGDARPPTAEGPTSNVCSGLE